VAGAIRWARFLLLRVQSPMRKLRPMNELLRTEQGELVRQRFIRLTTTIKTYEDKLVRLWLTNMKTYVPIDLKQTCLVDVEQHESMITTPTYRLSLFVNRLTSDDRVRSMFGKCRRANEKCHRWQYVRDPYGTMKPIEVRYRIALPMRLKQSLIECVYLEKQGVDVPESIIRIALQSDRFESMTDRLRSMLDDYHLTIASLDTNEVSLVQDDLEQLQQTIQSGLTRITWGALGHRDYLEQCQQQLNKLHSILNQIRKISTDIREHIDSIRSCTIDPIVPRHDDGEYCRCQWILLVRTSARFTRLQVHAHVCASCVSCH
jgi:hypothetical protein